MDDKPIWAADCVVASIPCSALTFPETSNEFAIKGNHLTLIKGNQFDGRIKTDPQNHIHEFLIICDMFKYKDTKIEGVLLMIIDVIDEILEEDLNALLDEGSEILYSIEETILKEKLFAEFDEFMAMTIDENSESKLLGIIDLMRQNK
nr:reverse transcriptase domain-containing protein [Tanacetum cinerariifolium]GEX55987.1 reverse transcriptase domain-containing protein [Tanacetum cinerariifolium]